MELAQVMVIIGIVLGGATTPIQCGMMAAAAAPVFSPAPPATSPFVCNGVDDLNCSDFRAIGQSANAHLAACGDEDRLDRDGDMRACER